MSHLSVFRNFGEALILNAVFNGEQVKKSIIRIIIRMRVGYKNVSLGITVCHHSASLLMPNGGPWD